MKLKMQADGVWVLRHRGYHGLFFGLFVLGLIPWTIVRGVDKAFIDYMFLLFFGGLCLWKIAEFSKVEITPDEIRYERNYLLFKRMICKKREDLFCVDLEVCPGMRGRGKRIRFCFKDGSHIAMPQAYVGSTIGWSIDRLYRSVRELFCELNQDRGDAILSLVSEGHIVSAIELVRRQHGMSLKGAKAFVDELKQGADNPDNGSGS